MNGAAGRALPSVVWGVIALAVLLCVWLLLRSGRQGAEAVIMHPFAPSHPRVYADNAAASSVGPQARAELIDRADRALAREPRIPLGGETTAAGRLYRTDPPYAGWTRVDGRSPDYRDGRINPAADRRDYEAATAAGREARDLGLAGVLTGERRYLSGSRDRLRAWCLDPATAMAPRFTTPQSRIEICVTVPAMILAADLLLILKRPHIPSTKESTLWVVFYVCLALVFAGLLWVFAGHEYAGQFIAGWLTEYSLSIDNLFVFVLIMSQFAVPRRYQQEVLMVGIIIALVLRGLFILAGAAIIEQFSWVFFIFGAFLIYTGIKLAVSVCAYFATFELFV